MFQKPLDNNLAKSYTQSNPEVHIPKYERNLSERNSSERYFPKLDEFQQRLNNDLFKSGSSEEASLYLTKDKIKNVSVIFPNLDPYIQGVLLQSVVFLPQFPSEDTEGSIVREYYFQMIKMGLESSDEWVRNIAELYQNYPNFSYDHLEKFTIDENFFHMEEESDSYFNDDDSLPNSYPKGIAPPSQRLKDNEIKPKPVEKPIIEKPSIFNEPSKIAKVITLDLDHKTPKVGKVPNPYKKTPKIELIDYQEEIPKKQRKKKK